MGWGEWKGLGPAAGRLAAAEGLPRSPLPACTDPASWKASKYRVEKQQVGSEPKRWAALSRAAAHCWNKHAILLRAHCCVLKHAEQLQASCLVLPASTKGPYLIAPVVLIGLLLAARPVLTRGNSGTGVAYDGRLRGLRVRRRGRWRLLGRGAGLGAGFGRGGLEHAWWRRVHRTRRHCRRLCLQSGWQRGQRTCLSALHGRAMAAEVQRLLASAGMAWQRQPCHADTGCPD